MKNHEAVKIVEDAIMNSGLSVFRIGNVTPTEFNNGEYIDFLVGKFRLIDVTVLVPDND